MIREYGTGKYRYEKRDDHLLFYGLRILNFRPLVLLVCAIAAGILCGCFVGMNALYLNLIIIPAFCIWFFWKKNRKCGCIIAVTAVAVCVLFTVGMFSFGMRIAEYENQPTASGKCLVSGVLEQLDRNGDKEICVFRDLEIVDGATGDIFSTDYRMKVFRYTSEGSGIVPGERVRFAADVTTYESRVYGRLNTSSILKKIRYRAVFLSDTFEHLERGPADVFELTDEYLHRILFRGMDRQNASLSYAMLTGNSGMMDHDVLQNFRYGGIAHIFAVSGLHIGILYALLNLVLKKIRLNRWARFGIIAAFLIFYSGVCQFSPSSVRALIMCLVFALADLIGFQYDILNAFSLAVLLILLLNPVHLFSVGFQLSVAAAGGIAVFGGHLSRCMRYWLKFPQKIASALGIAVSVQVCTFPILIDAFGFVSAISLVLNLIFIPIISFAYAFLFCSAVLSMIFPFAATVILYPSRYFLQLAVLPMFTELKIYLIGGFSFGMCAAIWYFWIVFLSDKINFRPWFKAIVSVVICAALVTGMVFRNVAWNTDGKITVHGYYDSNFAIVRENGETALIAYGIPEAEHVEQIFLKEGIKTVDVLIPLGSAQTVNNTIPVFLRFSEIETVCVPSGSGLVDSFHTTKLKETDEFFTFGNSSAKFENGNILYMNSGGTDLLFAYGNCPEDMLLPRCDVLIAQSDIRYAAECSPQKEIYFERVEGKSSVYRYGDLQLLRKNDIIFIKENN